MNFAAEFAENTGVGYGDHIYMNAQTNIFTVGNRKISLTPDQGALVGFFILKSVTNKMGFINAVGQVTEAEIESQFGAGVLDSTLKALSGFDVANDGGNGRLFYEEGIKGRDLIIENDKGYRFNAPLADLLKTGHVLSDEQLSSINHRPYWYKPMACCL